MSDQQRTRPKQGLDPAYPRLLGGRLCLDFANTLDGRASEPPEEFLHDYADLTHWGWHVGLLEDTQRKRLMAVAGQRPADAARTFSSAIALREAVFRVFSAIAAGSCAAEADLALVQRNFLAGLAHARLVARRAHFVWEWADEDHLGRMLWEVARSAVELLTEGDTRRVKQCAEVTGGCRGLFYDLSKNGSRRWCSMEGCGSHAKMRRYNARRANARRGAD
jgi:predicted RNA-binding Zn ribbon-like protein